jgi:hypothetical protein
MRKLDREGHTNMPFSAPPSRSTLGRVVGSLAGFSGSGYPPPPLPHLAVYGLTAQPKGDPHRRKGVEPGGLEAKYFLHCLGCDIGDDLTVPRHSTIGYRPATAAEPGLDYSGFAGHGKESIRLDLSNIVGANPFAVHLARLFGNLRAHLTNGPSIARP